MLQFIKKLAWYPPAETKIPLQAILSGFSKQPVNLKDELCKYINVKHCALGISARALLFKLIEQLKLHSGKNRDEILIPGYTCYSVAAAVAKANLKIAVYDLDPETLNPDLTSFKNNISEKTLAVVTQHLFGRLTPVNDLKRLTHEFGAYLIEDAAQAFGKCDDGGTPGTLGDFGLFSFGRGKPLPVGNGGALVSNDHTDMLMQIKFADTPNGYRQAALAAAMQIASKPALYWIPEKLPLNLGITEFDLGYDVAGMPGSVQKMLAKALPHLERLNCHRKRIGNIYTENISNKVQLKHQGIQISLIRYPVMLPKTISLHDLKQMGVRRMYPKAISDENSIKPYITRSQKPTLGAAEISEKLFTLPTHVGITLGLSLRIARVVQTALNSRQSV